MDSLTFPAAPCADVCWLTRTKPATKNSFETELRQSFRSYEMHSSVPAEGITANTVIFDLDSFSVNQLIKFRRMYPGGLIAVYRDKPPTELLSLLQYGIDDCMSTSDARMILARIRSLLTRSHSNEITHKVEKKGWSFDRKSLNVTPPDDKKLKLSVGQSRLLGLLIENEGRNVSRDEISEAIYGEPWVYGNRKIDMAIGGLRRKLEEANLAAKIRSISNRGYLLNLS